MRGQFRLVKWGLFGWKLHHISNMDTEMLSLVLDENRIYQEVNKDVFISKLASCRT